MRRFHFLIAILLALTVSACEQRAASPPTGASASAIAASAVASYFSGAELQAENDAQRAELKRAFNDMLTLTADELKAKRYADYAGVKNARSLLELIKAHVVPATPQLIDPARFYADVKTATALQSVRQQLAEMDKASASQPSASPAPTTGYR